MRLMRYHIPCIAILLLIAILAAGCGGGGGSTPDDRNGHRYWTVLVYMASDNNLEGFAIQDLNELETRGSTPEVTVLAQMDRVPGYDTSNGNWTGTRRFIVSRDASTSVIGSSSIDIGEQDMASPDTLHDFIAWGMQSYPADHYLLVMWDHGRGWRSRALTTQPRIVKAISVDDTSQSEMNLDDLSQGLSGTPKVDIILFDACLMGMIEVAAAVKDGAQFMVASEENVTASGQAYGEILNRLSARPSVLPEALSGIIVEEYAREYASAAGTFTMSALRLNNLDQLFTATDQLSSAILSDMAAVRNTVRTAQTQTQHFDYDNFDYDDYKDLYHFAELLGNAPSAGVRTAASSVRTATDSVVAHEWHRSAYMANSHGISIYLPPPGGNYLMTDYRALRFAQLTHWDEFLSSY